MPWFVMLALLVASFVLTSLMVKKQKAKPASLDEFKLPQAGEGTPKAMIFGDVWTPGWQVLWCGELLTIKIKSKGKKG